MRSTAPSADDRSSAARAAALDVAAVLVFVVAGRRSHDEDGNALSGAISVAAPFLIALGVGWALTRAWRRPTALVVGAGIWVSTVVVGMLLRRFVFDRGTATSFVIVATLVTGALLVGWRVVAALAVRRR